MNQSIDTFGTIILGILFVLLTYAGIIAYNSIDFQILQKLESQPLNLPTLLNPSPSAAARQP